MSLLDGATKLVRTARFIGHGNSCVAIVWRDGVVRYRRAQTILPVGTTRRRINASAGRDRLWNEKKKQSCSNNAQPLRSLTLSRDQFGCLPNAVRSDLVSLVPIAAVVVDTAPQARPDTFRDALFGGGRGLLGSSGWWGGG